MQESSSALTRRSFLASTAAAGASGDPFADPVADPFADLFGDAALGLVMDLLAEIDRLRAVRHQP